MENKEEGKQGRRKHKRRKGRISQIEIDEALEILWTLEEEGGEVDKESFKGRITDENDRRSQCNHFRRFQHGYRERITEQVLKELEKRRLAKINNRIKLTEKGRKKAQDIVRRHRLAERLMMDVLDMGKEEIEKPACEFEHLLSEEVTDRICTLLGHPRECPHGLPIPKGECCIAGKETTKPAVVPLSKISVGKEVEVAYIHTRNHSRIHKLLSYDIGPGSKIKVHQKKPVYVIKAGESDIALEEGIIKDVFVKPLD